METCKIQYLRKNEGRVVRDDNGEIIKNPDGSIKRVNKGQKKGVLFCGINPNDPQSVIVGFSLCNNMDFFDFPGGKKESGFGLNLAKIRAEKWSNHIDYFIQNSYTEDEILGNLDNDEHDIINYIDNPNSSTFVEIPPSILKRFFVFIKRCKRYYKDKEFPVWVNEFEKAEG